MVFAFVNVRAQDMFGIVVFGVLLVLVLGLYFETLAILGELKRRQKDLAESRWLEEVQKERLEAVVNNMADGVIGVDRTGAVTICNSALLSLLDTNANLVGKKIGEVVKLKDGKGKEFDLLKEIEDLNTIKERDDLTYKLDEGNWMKLEMVMSPIRNVYSEMREEEISGYILILRDITKAKSLEEERDEFISVISHELRTPVATLEGSISNLQVMTNGGVADKEVVRKGLSMAHEQILFLSGMINDLSMLSRAEHGDGRLRDEVNVKELMEGLFNRYEDSVVQRGLKLNLDIGNIEAMIVTNKLYLDEILQNFVTNAMKYTKEGSITLGAKKVKKGVEVFVTDTGIGIGKNEQRRVFDKFYRSEDYRTRETGGTGLGLYVVSKLARLIKSEVELESRFNHGSTFSLILPVKNKIDDTE